MVPKADAKFCRNVTVLPKPHTDATASMPQSVVSSSTRDSCRRRSQRATWSSPPCRGARRQPPPDHELRSRRREMRLIGIHGFGDGLAHFLV